MRKYPHKLYDAHAAKEALFEVEYLKHISAHYSMATRIVEKFAWTPTRMHDNHLIWLSKYYIYEQYYDTKHENHRILHQRKYTESDFLERKLKGQID